MINTKTFRRCSVITSVWNIDNLVKEKKNKSRISFSWGFEYRFLQELSDNLIQLISEYHKLDSNRLILLRHPSIPAYVNLKEYLNYSKIIQLTPELICIEGEITDKYMLHLKGTLAYLAPGQSYIDAIENIKNDVQVSKEEVEHSWQQRILHNVQLKGLYSDRYNVSTEQIAFNWGSGGSIELILWTLKNKCLKRPKVLINVPNYFYTCALAQKFDYEITPISSYDKGEYKFPASKIGKELQKNKYDIVVLTSPNNPFGVPISPKDFKSILDSLPPHTLALIDFTGLTGKSEFHIKDVLRNPDWINKRILMIDSLSKKFEMCHVRAGIIITSNLNLLKDLSIHNYSPILTNYAYSKMGEALNHPEITDKILNKHRRYFTLLKEVENRQFKLISPQLSNFVVSRFKTAQEVTRFISYLGSKFKYYDLPFRGIGIKNSGEGSITQDFIQYMAKNELRLLEETAPIIAKSIKHFFRSRVITQKGNRTHLK